MEELLLRIHAVLKRTKPEKASKELPAELVIGKIRYSYDQYLLHTPEETIKLTTKENELLRLFFEHLNHTVNRSVALKKIWKDDSYFNARSMDVYIAKLRKYLKADPDFKLLTVHGEGFKLIHVQ